MSKGGNNRGTALFSTILIDPSQSETLDNNILSRTIERFHLLLIKEENVFIMP